MVYKHSRGLVDIIHLWYSRPAQGLRRQRPGRHRSHGPPGAGRTGGAGLDPRYHLRSPGHLILTLHKGDW